MKATDLMIGDWISYIPEIAEGEDSYLGEPHNIQVDLSCLQKVDELIFTPILLTPEILEKNGWKDRENLMELRVNEDTYFLWSKGYGVFTGAFINQTGCYICDFKYVHTLQHILRSYGLSYGLNELNELADNFKV